MVTPRLSASPRTQAPPLGKTSFGSLHRQRLRDPIRGLTPRKTSWTSSPWWGLAERQPHPLHASRPARTWSARTGSSQSPCRSTKGYELEGWDSFFTPRCTAQENAPGGSPFKRRNQEETAHTWRAAITPTQPLSRRTSTSQCIRRYRTSCKVVGNPPLALSRTEGQVMSPTSLAATATLRHRSVPRRRHTHSTHSFVPVAHAPRMLGPAMTPYGAQPEYHGPAR